MGPFGLEGPKTPSRVVPDNFGPLSLFYGFLGPFELNDPQHFSQKYMWFGCMSIFHRKMAIYGIFNGICFYF